MAATREEVLAWMAETTPPRGYKAAARHFGEPVERVKKWAQRARGDKGGHGGTVGGERPEDVDGERIVAPAPPTPQPRAPARAREPRERVVPPPPPDIEAPDPAEVDLFPTLTTEQSLAMHLLLAGHTEEQVAKAIGVTVGKLRTWRRDPAFLAVYDEGLVELQTRARKGWLPKALTVLDAMAELAVNAFVDGKVRVAAGTAYLDRVGFPKSERVEMVEPGTPIENASEADLDRDIADAAALAATERGDLEMAERLRKAAGG